MKSPHFKKIFHQAAEITQQQLVRFCGCSLRTRRYFYSYRHNGTRGFVHTLSVTRAPGDFKQLAYTAERIRSKERLKTEFAAVTDVPLVRGNKCDDFVAAALREVSIEPVPMEGFAVWVAKLKPMLQ